jgi:DNA repair exonuclease SbcCD ATPase subunit
MIPRRVEVKGFLCYRDAQVVDLEGCDLWAFSGRNGSGKSAIFDAMTFALFGAHRGGQRGAENLIHTDASEFAIAFDFELGPERYRVRRSLRRGGRAERQVYRLEPADDGSDQWLAVAETNTDAGLRRWVAENVGLSFDMFTSSVLLRQGEADKLLSADPAERFKILASVVDLARYRRLHEQADARRRARKLRSDDLRAQLAGTPVVEPAAIEAAGARLGEAAMAVAVARTARDRLVEVEARARQWAELAARREALMAERETAERVLAEAASIRRDADRLRELDAVLPALGEAVARRERIARAVGEAARIEAGRDELVGKLETTTRLLDENRNILADLVAEIARDEERRRAIESRLAALAAPIQRATAARAQRAAVAEIGASIPPDADDLEAEVARLEDDVRRRAGWATALPSLESFAAARGSLAEAQSRSEDVRRRLAAAESRRLGNLLDDLTSLAAVARLDRDDARDRSTAVRTRLRAAEAKLRDFEAMDGSGACGRCGQPLTPEHFAREVAALRDERDDARAGFDDAEWDLRAAEDHAEAAESERSSAERDHREAEAELREARREAESAERDAARSSDDCARAFGHLGDSFRLAVAPRTPPDWLTTTFPTPADLDEGRRERDGLAEAEQALETARSRRESLRDTRSRLTEAQRALAAIGLRLGDEEAEAEHMRLSDESAALDRCLAGHRRDRAAAEATAARLAGEIETLKSRVAEADRHLAGVRARVEEWQGESARARASFPGSWHAEFDTADADRLDRWEAERRSLRDRGIEALADELPRAEGALRHSEAAMAGIEAQIAAIPEEARRDPKLIARVKAEADANLDAAEAEHRARHAEFETLRRDHRARADLGARAREAERDWLVSDTLAGLLGRDGLQRELLRDAERGVLDHANPILCEISGGEIELRLAGEGREEADEEHALALEARVRTHGATRAVDVAYLSGSQRFRVAVSLALGIGQYARGLDRPIESVVIDEGFGCLDRQGRDEMIAELNALRGRLACVVLVSHQEEFADAFSDGYHFEIEGGTTVARPFHR